MPDGARKVCKECHPWAALACANTNADKRDQGNPIRCKGTMPRMQPLTSDTNEDRKAVFKHLNLPPHWIILMKFDLRLSFVLSANPIGIQDNSFIHFVFKPIWGKWQVVYHIFCWSLMWWRSRVLLATYIAVYWSVPCTIHQRKNWSSN